ncbi:FAD-dependent oxidoreductase [Streptomyces sp. NPDC014744]|uniref:FAD-dependent oxidoreductase n=1 Tax=Streptomyces sp. NPDC014744 TaxID=3364903 RepID=UPI0036FD6F04
MVAQLLDGQIEQGHEEPPSSRGVSDHPWIVGHTVRARRSGGDGRPCARRKSPRLLDGCRSGVDGRYRLHPVEWNVGEVAGALAAHCVAEGVEPRQVQGGTSGTRPSPGSANNC